MVDACCKNWKIIFKKNSQYFKTKLRRVSRDIFRSCESCLEAEVGVSSVFYKIRSS
jgi:hypothetical protein